MTRASVLILTLLILNTLLGGLCIVVARSERRSLALRDWGWGLLIYSVGLLITLADFLPFDLRKVVGNTLIAYAPILTVSAIARHTPHSLRRSWVLIGFALSVLPILVNHLDGHYRVLVDLLAPAPIANVLFLLGIIWLLRDPPIDARGAARFLAGILALSVLVWTIRIALIWASIGSSNDRDRADLTIALFCIAQVVIAVGATLGLLWVEVRLMEAELRRQADADALTGLPNRRASMRRFGELAAQAMRDHRSFALLLMDIDHFKRVNDTHGHLAGDAALRHVATTLRTCARAGDLVGRIGGEEFICMLTELRDSDALQAAERLREVMESARFEYEGRTLAVTLSGGLAFFPFEGRDWDRLFAVADQRLYDAKEGGRNRIVTTSERALPPAARRQTQALAEPAG